MCDDAKRRTWAAISLLDELLERACPSIQYRLRWEVLGEMLAAGQGCFAKPLSHPYFRKWGAYTGLLLERDWRDPQRRIYDLTFRSLLILHYVEC